MAKSPSRKSVNLRLAWLQRLGGLPRPAVQNREWLALLKEETRQSLMIEGHFWTPEEVERIVSARKGADEVIGYFDAALYTYEFAYAQYRDNECQLTKPHIRQIHALMYRGANVPAIKNPGEWRRGTIKIGNAKIVPPSPAEVDSFIERYIRNVASYQGLSPWRKAALAHVLFEAIHPFPDGNGRTGRIILNFFLICSGLPNVVVKGEKDQEKKYFDALEEADYVSRKFFDGTDAFTQSDLLHLKPLEDLILSELAPSMDDHICAQFELITGVSLLPYEEVARLEGRKERSLQVSLSSKQLIGTKRKNHLLTHPLLLQEPPGVLH